MQADHQRKAVRRGDGAARAAPALATLKLADPAGITSSRIITLQSVAKAASGHHAHPSLSLTAAMWESGPQELVLCWPERMESMGACSRSTCAAGPEEAFQLCGPGEAWRCRNAGSGAGQAGHARRLWWTQTQLPALWRASGAPLFRAGRRCQKPPYLQGCLQWCWPMTYCRCATRSQRRCCRITSPMCRWCCAAPVMCCAIPRQPPVRFIAASACQRDNCQY